MKKFTQYLKPEQKPTKEQPKTIVDQAWSNARKKIEEQEKLNQIALEEETKKQQELKKKLFVEKIVDVNHIREEFTGEHLFEEEQEESEEEQEESEDEIQYTIGKNSKIQNILGDLFSHIKNSSKNKKRQNT